MLPYYDVVIEPTEHNGQFTGQFIITWKDVDGNIVDTFPQPIPARLSETLELWRLSIHQSEIGEMLFHFLNGEGNVFKKILDKAKGQNDPIHVNIQTCRETADWPFEYLSFNGEFLLHRSLHLIRKVPGSVDAKPVSPGTGALQLLFMSCSAVDVIPEMDFDAEEEAIFKITESLTVDVDIEDSGSIAGLRNRLREKKYHIIVLSALTGFDEYQTPFFVMEDEFGYAQHIHPSQLWEEALIENPPHVLFLSGSDTGKTPSPAVVGGKPQLGADTSFARSLAASTGLPAVLGWGNSVIDDAAICAAGMLFRDLSRGRSVLAALQRTRNELVKKFPFRGQGTWAALRLYGTHTSMGPVVKYDQQAKRTPKRMQYFYLYSSWVRVLKKGFIGRRRPLQTCLRTLKKDTSKYGILLTGSGGLGKSCLAGKVCERFSHHTLIIVQGKLNSVSMEDALKDAFTISQDEEARQILAQSLNVRDKLAILCKSCFKKKNHLFLLDDFEQNMENSDTGQPGPLLPEAQEVLTVLLHHLPYAGKQTQLIITSRYGFSLVRGGVDLAETHLETIPVISLSHAENRKKLRILENIFPLYDPQQGIGLLLLDLGCGNPRLLESLDTLVKEKKGADIQSLLADIKGKREEFIKTHVLRELILHGGEQLTQFLQGLSIYRRPVTQDGFLGMIDDLGIPSDQSLLQRGIDLGLIECDIDHKHYRYMVPALVRDELLREKNDYGKLHQYAFDYYRELCDNKDTVDAQLVEEWIFHALGCGREDVATLHGARLISSMYRRQALREALETGEWILKAKKNQSRTAPDAFLFNEIAVAAFSLGKFHKAVGYYRNALAIDTELNGEDHEEVASDLSNMGLALLEIKEYRDAKVCFQKALNINKKIFGPIHEKVSQVMNNFGSTYFYLGKFKEARTFFENALSIDLEVYGDRHPQTAISLNNVGEVLKRLGHPGKAIDYLLFALSIDSKFYEYEHPAVGRDLTNVGSTYYSLGDFNTAVHYLNQAYVIFRKRYGRYHIDLARVLNYLGIVMHGMKNYDDSIVYLEEALTIHEKLSVKEHPTTGVIINNLGEAWRCKGDSQRAITYFQQGLAICRKAYNETHHEVATGLGNLGLTKYDQGLYEDALTYLEQSLTINKTVFGEEHPSIAENYYNMGMVYEARKKKEKAKEDFNKSYHMFMKFYPPDHPWVILTRNKVASIKETA